LFYLEREIKVNIKEVTTTTSLYNYIFACLTFRDRVGAVKSPEVYVYP